MRVAIKRLDTVQMEVKNKGIEIEIRNTNGKHLGNIFLNKKGMQWCKAKVGEGKGEKITWQEFIEYMEDDQ